VPAGRRPGPAPRCRGRPPSARSRCGGRRRPSRAASARARSATPRPRRGPGSGGGSPGRRRPARPPSPAAPCRGDGSSAPRHAPGRRAHPEPLQILLPAPPGHGLRSSAEQTLRGSAEAGAASQVPKVPEPPGPTPPGSPRRAGAIHHPARLPRPFLLLTALAGSEKPPGPPQAVAGGCR